ncbi:hypothetical protein [Nitriliruptor alkaliphilus]|uniref:hypothetical protein n=1 Tax=Nitriliruptor alkaliphilus TaxID=427918 RepID=UPI000696E778|nr:hypothetical protein [Nitriliruptor alkaliphilus]
MTARVAGLAALALVLGACGQGGPTPSVDPGTDAAAPDGGAGADDGATATPVDLPTCPEWDAPRTYDPPPEDQPEPDAALTTANVNPDIPVEADGEDAFPGEHGALLGQARDWAEREAPDHYAGLWLDNQHGATVMAFTDEVDRYAAELRERFGAGWWVVRGEHSYADLLEVQATVNARMGGGADSVGTPPGTVVGSGLRDDIQRVTVTVVGGDTAALTELAADLDHPAVCFEVLDPPPSYDPDGPVRTLATVPGWRDDLDPLGDGALEIAYDREVAERAFAENVPDDLPRDAGHAAEDGLHADLDTVDWDREVLVIWSGGRSGSCPVWVEDVHLDGDRVAVAVASPSEGACTADFNPFRAVLAVDRDRLPTEDALPMPVGDRPDIEAVPYPAG